jgi:hypothetical protein
MKKPEPIIHDPGNVARIDEVYVFMSIDDEGRNGIVAELLVPLGTVQLATGSLKAVELMKPLAQKVAERTGKPVGMFRFKRDAQLWQTDE